MVQYWKWNWKGPSCHGRSSISKSLLVLCSASHGTDFRGRWWHQWIWGGSVAMMSMGNLSTASPAACWTATPLEGPPACQSLVWVSARTYSAGSNSNIHCALMTRISLSVGIQSTLHQYDSAMSCIVSNRLQTQKTCTSRSLEVDSCPATSSSKCSLAAGLCVHESSSGPWGANHPPGFFFMKNLCIMLSSANPELRKKSTLKSSSWFNADSGHSL